MAGHMYRMAVMALFLEDDSYDKRILNGSAVVVPDVGEWEPGVGVAAELDDAPAHSPAKRKAKMQLSMCGPCCFPIRC